MKYDINILLYLKYINTALDLTMGCRKVLITAPKKIIQDTTYNVRQESEFICSYSYGEKCLLALTLGWRYNSSLYGN